MSGSLWIFEVCENRKMYVLGCIGEDKERFGKQSEFVVFLIILAFFHFYYRDHANECNK